MKKVKLLVLALIIAMSSLAFIGCGSDQASSTTADQKADEKVYLVGTDAAFPPFESTLPSGEIVGFDVDLMNAIAEAAGIKVEIKHLGWDPMLKGVENGNADIGASGITINDERKEFYGFTEPYFEATQLIMVPSDSTVASLKDLEGQNIGVQSGTTGEIAVKKIFGDNYTGIKGYEDLPTAMADLLTGRTVAVVGDNAVLAELLKKSPDQKLKLVSDDTFDKEYYGFIVKKGNTELLEKLNQGLKTIKENGTYDEIYGKYFAE